MSNTFNPSDHPHKRLNPLTNEWVLVSPHRAKRPWQGQQDQPAAVATQSHDEHCYLCAGNKRISGEQNPNYPQTFVFENDFAALQPTTPDAPEATDPLFQLQAERGEARVLCYSPNHSLTLPLMSHVDTLAVVNTWVDQYSELAQRYEWVQIFENKGDVMGCSQPHPHGQIWANSSVPTLPAKEHEQQMHYYQQQHANLLLDYAQRELANPVRVVVQGKHWVALVPFWAAWPFETLLLPHQRVISHFDQLNEAEKGDLAQVIKQLTTRYDNLFQTSFPYSMGWHGAPTSESDNPAWQLHAHFYPPLLRSASVKKFMVGYEMLAEPQRDLTPEQAAERLQSVSDVHYKEA